MSTLYYESSLAHHGVRGMKWGVRRYQTSDGRWTNLGRKHNQVKDLKRSEKDKTDRTKARLENQKKKLAYEKSLGPSEHPARDAIGSKAKTVTKDIANKAKAEKAKYDTSLAESKANKSSKEDAELANFMKSMAMVSLNAVSKSGNIKNVTKNDIKNSWNVKIKDVKSDLVDRIDEFRFR